MVDLIPIHCRIRLVDSDGRCKHLGESLRWTSTNVSGEYLQLAFSTYPNATSLPFLDVYSSRYSRKDVLLDVLGRNRPQFRPISTAKEPSIWLRFLHHQNGLPGRHIRRFPPQLCHSGLLDGDRRQLSDPRQKIAQSSLAKHRKCSIET